MRGTKTEIQPGVWRLRVYIGRRPNGTPIQASATFRGGSRAAEAELRRLVNKVEQSRTPDRSATLARLLTEWMANRKKASPLTLTADQGYIDHRILPALGHLRLDRITGRDLDRAYAAWLTDGLAPSTVHKMHTILSAAFTQAVKWEWIDRSPAARATPPSRAAATVTRAISPAEFTALIQAARAAGDDTLAVAISLGGVTGARRGELCALRRSDLTDGTLTISRSVSTLKGGELLAGATKTHQVRRLALDPSTLALIDWWWAQQARLADQVGVALDRDPYLLADPERPRCDRPILPQTLSKKFMRLARRAGMDYHLHELRHFAATTMITAGVDARTTASRLGHARPGITLSTYAHAVAAVDAQAAALLGSYLPALPG